VRLLNSEGLKMLTKDGFDKGDAMKNTNFLRAVVFCAISMIAFSSMAFTSIASIPGHVNGAFWRTSNYSSQKEADTDALKGCRAEARKNGVGQLAAKCKVLTQAKGPGYGAVTCGENGCSWSTGYGDFQAAVDAAFGNCSKSYRNCNGTDIKYWEDRAGFKTVVTSSRTTEVNRYSCTNSCMNGSCLRTFPDGSQERWQAPRVFNPSKGDWEWDTNSCGN
jgi:hypothetical protein